MQPRVMRDDAPVKRRPKMQQKAARDAVSAIGLSSGSYLSEEDFSAREMEIQEAIASRAFNLFEERGRADGDDLKDWFGAESDVLLPISAYTYEFEDNLTMRAEVPLLAADVIEVRVEEQRIVICDRGPLFVDADNNVIKRVFHAVALPEPVDWENASISFGDGVLEIVVPKLTLTAQHLSVSNEFVL